MTLVFAALYVALGAIVLLFPGYVDPGEPFIMSAAYFSTHSKQVYDLLIAYGPVCFLPYGVMMRLFGPSLATVKCTILLGNLALVPLLYVALRRFLRPASVMLVISLVMAACCMRQAYTFQARGDLFIYLGVVLALIAHRSRSMVLAIALMSLALSMAIGVKITALLYLLYPCALLLRRHGWPAIVGTAFGATALLLLPFGLPNLDLGHYVHWILAMSAAPRSKKELIGNLFTTVVILAPLALMFWQFLQRDRDLALRYLRERRLALAALSLGLLGIGFLGGKFGAGRHHLIPFFFITGYVVSELYDTLEKAPKKQVTWPASLAFGWGTLGLLLLLSLTGQIHDEWQLSAREKADALALSDDVRSIMAQHAGQSIELGVGHGMDHLDERYNPMYAAPQVVASGGTYLLDPSAETDAEAAGVPMPRQVYEDVHSCRSQLWLIPRGEAPFRTESLFSMMYPRDYPHHAIFTNGFRHTFQSRYRHVASSAYFDLYQCRTAGRVLSE